MLGCHDFQNAAGKFMKPIFFSFSVTSCNSHVLFFLSLHRPTVIGSCSVVVTIPKPWLLQLPRTTPGARKAPNFCAIKLPAFISHAIQLHFFCMTEKI